ncbi:hypothetical protein TNCV_438571 [Trichonephila clavipes]|nr:hypothetical protein TNCV_438571 [Trichonephila clavipes]
MPTLPVPTDDVVSRILIESSALWSRWSSSILAWSQNVQATSAGRPSQRSLYFQKAMSGGLVKAGNSLIFLQVPWDRTHIGQSFPWLSKVYLDHCSTFVYVCGYNAFCSSEGQGDFWLRRLGSLHCFLVSSPIAGNPNMTWDPL